MIRCFALSSASNVAWSNGFSMCHPTVWRLRPGLMVATNTIQHAVLVLVAIFFVLETCALILFSVRRKSILVWDAPNTSLGSPDRLNATHQVAPDVVMRGTLTSRSCGQCGSPGPGTCVQWWTCRCPTHTPRMNINAHVQTNWRNSTTRTVPHLC